MLLRHERFTLPIYPPFLLLSKPKFPLPRRFSGHGFTFFVNSLVQLLFFLSSQANYFCNRFLEQNFNFFRVLTSFLTPFLLLPLNSLAEAPPFLDLLLRCSRISSFIFFLLLVLSKRTEQDEISPSGRKTGKKKNLQNF